MEWPSTNDIMTAMYSIYVCDSFPNTCSTCPETKKQKAKNEVRPKSKQEQTRSHTLKKFNPFKKKRLSRRGRGAEVNKPNFVVVFGDIYIKDIYRNKRKKQKESL